MQSILSTLSGLVFLAAFGPYVRAILRGETKPAKASWIIWGCLDWISLIAMIQEKAVNGLIMGAVAGATLVVVLALIKGKPGWTWLDKFCLAGGGAGLVLWWASGNPMYGLLISQAILFTGSFPTFLAAFKRPEEEHRGACTMYWVGALLGVLAIPTWTLADAAQPITFLAIESVMMYLLYRPRVAQTT